MFVLDAFGGTEAMEESEEDRKIPASIGIDGVKRLPKPSPMSGIRPGST